MLSISASRCVSQQVSVRQTGGLPRKPVTHHNASRIAHSRRFVVVGRDRDVSTSATAYGRRSMFKRLFGGLLVGAGVAGAGGAPSVTAVAATTKASEVLLDPKYPADFPFRPEDFGRYDESSDAAFYQEPRFVAHIDDKAIAALTQYYAGHLPTGPDAAVLDICSSWISHYPQGFSAGKVSGLGMNESELARNEVLTDYVVKDLNEDPVLPYPDESFDVITNAVSVDYLTKPLEVFKEMNRVLKPGGRAIMSFSNRCFPTKAIAIWTMSGDLDHIWIVGSYYHYAGGFTPPTAEDISPNKGKTDPMYVVTATKLATPTTSPDL